MYAQTLPEIDATGSEAQNPFLLTFSIRNPSAWFEMSDVKYTCNLALSSGNTKITGGTLSRELAAIPAARQLLRLIRREQASAR